MNKKDFNDIWIKILIVLGLIGFLALGTFIKWTIVTSDIPDIWKFMLLK